MNRQIKFRAWLIEEETMVFSENQASTDFQEIWVIVNDGVRVDVLETYHKEVGGEIEELLRYVEVPQNVMRFTGLPDKNGTDMYEGDILKYHSGGGTLRKIVYKQAAFHAVTLDEKQGSPNHPLYFASLAPTGTSEIEVVGNIYQNPELIANDK